MTALSISAVTNFHFQEQSGLPCPPSPPVKRGELEGGGGVGAAYAGFSDRF